MIIPFYRLPVRRKRDILLARLKARQVAHFFHFDAQQEACITAGTFAIGCQALLQFSQFEIVFQVDHHKLEIFAEIPNHTSSLPPNYDKNVILLKLAKDLPESSQVLSSDDLTWMMSRLEQQVSLNLFEEVCRQNQEILMFLHALQKPLAGGLDAEDKGNSAA